MLHELIDQNEPRCLYCNSKCDLDSKSEWSTKFLRRMDKEVLFCRKCKEIFTIHSSQGDDGITEYDGFLFSCEDVYVYSHYIDNVFFLGHTIPNPNPVKIPSFTVDFSDKEKLYEKLKTYLIFS